MAIFDRMLDAMNLGEDDDYYDDDEMYDDDYDDDDYEEDSHSIFHLFGKRDEVEDEAPVVKSKANTSVSNTSVKEKPVVKTSPKITPMRNSKKGGANMEVCVIKPSSFEDAREISETLLDDRTVILNMEGLDLGLAQRIIDFTSGCCYAIDGNLQKVSNYIFIITPSMVNISGDLQGLVDAFGVTGIQTGF